MTSAGQTLFVLQGALNAETVMSAWPDRLDVLRKASAATQSVALDLAKVEHVDTAGLAWLVQLVSQCKALQIAVRFQQIPESLQKLAKISDVERLLPLQ